MPHLHSSENLQTPQILQFETNPKDPKFRFQKIHNIIARYINVINNEINSRDMTPRAIAYLGLKNQIGDESLFLHFINRISESITSMQVINQSELEIIKDLLTEIGKLETISPQIVADCTKQIQELQKEINQSNPNLKIYRITKIPAKTSL